MSMMCKQKKPLPEYIIYSGRNSNLDIKTIDTAKSNIPVSDGGLKWRFIHNFWITKDILWQSGLIKLSLYREFDAIIYLGQMYFISTWVSAFLARLSGKRVLMWTHGFIKVEANLKGWIRSCFYKLADGILLYGNRARRIMISKGFDPNKLFVVYNSLDYHKQKFLREKITQEDCKLLRKKLFDTPELPILLFVGRLTSTKKLNMILQAAHILTKRNFLLNILFVGDGNENSRLKHISKELGIDKRVRFYGACHNEEELAVINLTADICVSPGEVGLTAMLSLAYGTPVITHDNFSNQGPEYEAIQNGLNGRFFKENDTEDLAMTIQQWLEDNVKNKRTPEQCYGVIEKYYNSEYQIGILNSAVMGGHAET